MKHEPRASGQAALSGHVSALTSQLELLVTSMASSTGVQTPAAQVKSAAAPDDPEDDDDTIDRFATANNAQCVRLQVQLSVLRVYDPSTEAVDAFSQDWSDETSWVNPPWQLLGRVVVKLQESKNARATVVRRVRNRFPIWVSTSGPVNFILLRFSFFSLSFFRFFLHHFASSHVVVKRTGVGG